MSYANLALSDIQLERAAPSIFAKAPLAGVSDRYRFVSTSEVIDLFRSEGWDPVKACEHRVRSEDRRGFQSHQIRFARRDDLARAFEVKDVRPELVLRNSHDRSTAFRVDAGLYRKVCANGLVISDEQFPGMSMRHLDVSPDAFVKGASQVLDAVPRLIETVSRWKSLPMTEAKRLDFAAKALALRWDEPADLPTGLNPKHILTPRRTGEASNDLWITFNVVQENLVRGVRYYHGLSRTKTRKIGSPAVDLALNKRLWALAADYSNN